MSAPKSNELLTQEISYMRERLEAIEKKLDEKYVSHESFDLVIKSIHADVRELKELPPRVGALENWRWYMIGTGAIGMILIPIITTIILRNI